MTEPTAEDWAAEIVRDEPQNEYGRGFVAGYRQGHAAGKASRQAEIDQYRRRIHELEQQFQAIRLDLHRVQNAAVPAVHLPRDLAL